MTAAEVVALLRARRYESPEWFTLEQVQPSKGVSRFIDLLCVNIWSTRGFPIDGVEIKVSRADWTKERRDPAKAEACIAAVEAYWLAAPEGVATLDEIPGPWGFFEIKAGKVFVRKEPARVKRGPLAIAEVAAILQRVISTWKGPEEFEAELQRRATIARDSSVGRQQALDQARARIRELEAELRAVDAVAGTGWRHDGELMERTKRIREALDAAAAGGVMKDARNAVERAMAPLRRAMKGLEGAAQDLQGGG